jgi:hypothetical protein
VKLYVSKKKKQKPNVPDQGPVHLLPDPRRGLTMPVGGQQEKQASTPRQYPKWIDPGTPRGALVLATAGAVIGGVILLGAPSVAPVVVHLVAHLWPHVTAALI